MTDSLWLKNEEHPPLAVLALYLESELGAKDADRVRSHVQSCWECRTRLECMNQGVCAFMDYRRDALIDRIPSPPERLIAWRGLWRDLLGKRGPSRLASLAGGFRSLLSFFPRVAWIATGVSLVCLLAILKSVIVTPPNVTAAEFLHRVRTSSPGETTATHKHFSQKIAIRQGRSSFKRVVRPDTLMASTEQSPDPALKEALLLARVDWRDPLNGQNFADWHDALPNAADKVWESPSSWTLETTPVGDYNIRRASLTVSRIDWRPIAKHIEFYRQPPIDILELSFTLEDESPSAAQLNAFAQPQPVPANHAGKEKPASLPTTAQLEDAEARLRETLHKLNADVNEFPVIQRQQQKVKLSVFAQTASRREEILDAVRNNPYLIAEVTDPETVASAPKIASASQPLDTPAYTTKPPLAKQLWEHFGSMDLATAYMIRVRESYLPLLREASALKALADRYPDDTWSLLSPDSRRRIESIATDHVAKIGTLFENYLAQVSPVLDEMMRSGSLSGSQGKPRNDATCLSWRADSDEIQRELQQLQTAFRRLFMTDQSDVPIVVEPAELLREAAAARGELSAVIEKQVCQSQGNLKPRIQEF